MRIKSREENICLIWKTAHSTISRKLHDRGFYLWSWWSHYMCGKERAFLHTHGRAGTSITFFLAFDDTYYESWGYCNDSSTANIMLSSIKARRVFATILTSKNIKYYKVGRAIPEGNKIKRQGPGLSPFWQFKVWPTLMEGLWLASLQSKEGTTTTF